MQLTIDGKVAYAATLGHTPDPRKPSIAFIHGAAMDHSVWTTFARYFVRHGYNALAFDLPGHGRSDGPAMDRVEHLAAWCDEAFERLGIERAALVGHSLGSLVAFELAASTRRVAALALVGTAMPMPVTDALLDAAKTNQPLALDMINVWGHGPSAHYGGFSTPGMWMVGAQARLIERTAPGVLFADLSACNEYRSGLDKAPEVDCPTTLVLGERDMMTPVRASRKLARALPDSEVEVIADTGHALMAERPNQVLDALIGLASRVALAA